MWTCEGMLKSSHIDVQDIYTNLEWNLQWILFKYIYTLFYAELTGGKGYHACVVTVFYTWACEHITLTHPLGVAWADSSQQTATAGWGPKINIPVCSKVSSDVDVYLWHGGVPSFSQCRETSVRWCCFQAIHSWGYEVGGQMLQSQWGYETSLAQWQSLGWVVAPRKGQRRSSSARSSSDRCRALGRQVEERSNGAPRMLGAAQQPGAASVPLP